MKSLKIIKNYPRSSKIITILKLMFCEAKKKRLAKCQISKNKKSKSYVEMWTPLLLSSKFFIIMRKKTLWPFLQIDDRINFTYHHLKKKANMRWRFFKNQNPIWPPPPWHIFSPFFLSMFQQKKHKTMLPAREWTKLLNESLLKLKN